MGYIMNGNNKSTPLGGIVTVKFTLAGLLKQLESHELKKNSNERHQVPTITELAKVTGVSRVAMSNLANGNLESVNTSTLSVVLSFLRIRGFPVQIGDVFTVEETAGEHAIATHLYAHLHAQEADKLKSPTGLSWVRPQLPLEEIDPPTEAALTNAIERAIMGNQQRLVEEDGRSFSFETRPLFTEDVGEYRIYNSITLVCLMSLEDVELGDYVHTSVIDAPFGSQLVKVDRMLFRRDSAHGFTAWRRIE